MLSKINFTFFICILFFFCSACSKAPAFPKKDIAGLMRIEYNEQGSAYYTVLAHFTVDVSSGIFTAYLQDENAYPLGRIVMQGKKVVDSDIPVLVHKNKFFKFWPYLFNEESYDNSKISLLKRMWEEYDGLRLPGEVNIKSKRYNMYIKMEYAD